MGTEKCSLVVTSYPIDKIDCCPKVTCTRTDLDKCIVDHLLMDVLESLKGVAALKPKLTLTKLILNVFRSIMCIEPIDLKQHGSPAFCILLCGERQFCLPMSKNTLPVWSCATKFNELEQEH